MSELEIKKKENNEILEEIKKIKEEKIKNDSIVKELEQKLNSQNEFSNDIKIRYEECQKNMMKLFLI